MQEAFCKYLCIFLLFLHIFTQLPFNCLNKSLKEKEKLLVLRTHKVVAGMLHKLYIYYFCLVCSKDEFPRKTNIYTTLFCLYLNIVKSN